MWEASKATHVGSVSKSRSFTLVCLVSLKFDECSACDPLIYKINTPSKEEGKEQKKCSLTTSPSTRVRTLSPISGEMSLPNCCKVVRNLFSLLSCLAPQAGGNCWLAREEEEEEDGPLLKPLGGDGAPFNAVGEWLVPLVTERKRDRRIK